MDITVSEQAKQFYLALKEEWRPVVGHEIKVGKYRFCVVPMTDMVNVSEVTTGCKVSNIPMSPEIMIATSTKEDSIKWFHKVGESILRIIENTDNFDEMLTLMKSMAYERLGEMPPVKDIDTHWVFADTSDVLN
ncbi:hypothetical protein KO561_05235 [Radiobacillus kanasensis]|uniref:hypothetical protein n=1 Tax=Radiobacillus kanasensis TaxID=2844358 RepID=UPI001E5994FB|nr:hypothetical protein [Radiobacillus kanasensis]UFU00354.1 hypothetical protein KO561_05235 [Radiobacillus kanasensis]